MPLISDRTPIGLKELRSLLVEHLERLGEARERLDEPGFPATEPLGIAAARALLESVIALSKDAAGPGTERARLALVVNVQAEALAAALDLMKVHSTLPRVPRSKGSSASGAALQAPT